MKFTLENGTGVNTIRAHGPQGIRVAGTLVTSHCLVTADRLETDWPVTTASRLTPGDFTLALSFEPELIVVGTGRRLEFPPADVQAAVQAAGVGFEAMDTGAACRTYNVLVSEGRRVVAALLLER